MRSDLWVMFAAVVSVAAGLFSPVISAEGFPDKPIKLVIPYPPGGAGDSLGRPLSIRLREVLGQSIVIDNKAGANGIVGMASVAHSPADGYTLAMGAIGPVAVSSALQKLPFDPVKDFVPVSFLALVPNVLVVNSNTNIKSVATLVALAKQSPGKLNYGSAGTASSNQLAAELFNQAAGVKITHVPYKGGAPADADLMAGHLSLIFGNLPSALPHIQSGAFRALAVTSLERQPSLPDVPTMAELGYPNFESGSWFGVLAPAGTPRAVVDRLNKAITEALRDPGLREPLLKQGFNLNPGTPEQFGQFIQSETVKWHSVVKSAGITNQ